MTSPFCRVCVCVCVCVRARVCVVVTVLGMRRRKLDKLCVCAKLQFFVTPWTVARQTSLSMGFSRQESWSGLPCPEFP